MKKSILKFNFRGIMFVLTLTLFGVSLALCIFYQTTVFYLMAFVLLCTTVSFLLGVLDEHKDVIKNTSSR
jgi:hypothetical protein